MFLYIKYILKYMFQSIFEYLNVSHLEAMGEIKGESWLD